MFKRLALILPLLLLIVFLTPSQPAYARFNSLPDLFNLPSTSPTGASWPVDAYATCSTVTVELSYPADQNPVGIPNPYDSVTWSLERVMVNGNQAIEVSETNKTIHTFPYDTPGGQAHAKTFTFATPLEAGTGLFIEVRYTINGGELNGGTGVFDIGDFDHPYWHIRTYDPASSPLNTQHFCADSTSAPSVYVLGDVVRKEGNGGIQNYQTTIFLDKPSNKPVRVDIESPQAAGLPYYAFTFPTFNGYSSRGIQYGTAVCVDSGPDCITPSYTTLTIPPGETQITLNATLGSDTSPEVYYYEPYTFSIIRTANAKIGSASAQLLAHNDDGCLDSPPGACFVEFLYPGGSTTDYPIDKYSFLVSNQTVNETAGSVTFTVTLTDPVDSEVSLQYETTSEGYNAIAGEDYTTTSGTLVFPANVLTKDITVPIIANPQAEGLEAFGIHIKKIGSVYKPDDVTVGALIVNDYVVIPTATPTSTQTAIPSTATPTTQANATATSTAQPNVTTTPTGTSQPGETLTPTSTAQTAALLLNGDFELKDQTQAPLLAPWTLKNLSLDKIKCNKATKIVANTGECAFMLRGVVGENTYLSQKVGLEAFTFGAGDTLTLTAYINAKGAAIGKLKMTIKYTDETLEKDKISLDLRQTEGYEVFTNFVTLDSEALKSIKVTMNHLTPSGKVFVDTFSLSRSSGLLPLP